MNPETIKNILIKHDIHVLNNSEVSKRCNINEEYFDKVDDHRKAYYLGLLFADGNISKNKNTVQISLQEKDKHILEQFKKDICADYKIGLVKCNDKNPNWQNQYYLSITNKKFHDSLLKYGFVPNKSLILQFPQNLPEEFYSSFILGYMDGDGNISKKEKRISLVSTESFCESIKNIVESKLNIHCSIILCHNNDKVTTRTLSIAGYKQVKLFLDWIYSDCDIYLENMRYIELIIVLHNFPL